MWNVLSVSAAKLIFIDASASKLNLARSISRWLAHGVVALGLVMATAGVALAAPVIHTSGPNFGAASVGPNEYQLTASGGDGVNYTWTLVPGFGTLPPGMAIRTDTPWWFPPSARAGLIGVATTPGTYHFRLRASSGTEFADQDYTFTISSLMVKDQYQVFDAYVGEPYSYRLTAQRDGVDVTASWAPNGAFPAGLSLTANGILQGTPTTAGSYDFSYSVTEGGQTVYKAARIAINLIHITTDTLPNALQGSSYSASVVASGGSNTYSFAITNGGLPSGLALNAASGAIAGTITGGPGVYGVYITATDTVNHASVSKWIGIDVIGVPPTLPWITPYGNAFQDATLGQSFAQGISIRNGGRAPFTWAATGLPPGVSIRWIVGTTNGNIFPGDAEIWGSPAAAGVSNIVFTVTDADGVKTSNTFALRVSRLGLTQYLNNGTLGSPYTSTLRVIGGTAPYTAVQIDGRLPIGLNLAGATQIVSGTPGENGSFGAQFRFSDADVNTLDLWSGLFIGGPTITINMGDDLGTTSTGGPYSRQLFACCAAVVSWSVVDPATLPPGIGLSSSTGILSGTPTASGTYTFIVKATADGSATNFALHQFTLVVTPVLVTTNAGLPFGNVGSPYGGAGGLQLNATGGTGPYTWTLLPGSYTPPGMALSSTGVLSGTPTSTGQYPFTVKVADNAGHFRYWSFGLSIYPAGGGPPPGFNFNTNLGTWPIGQVDGQQLTGNGGNGTYTFSFEGGTLPPGLAIRTDVPSFFPAGSSGLIGVATTPGTYVFQLGVTSGGIKTVQTFTMKIVNLVVMNLYTQLNTYVGQPFSFQLIALRDGAPVPATWTASGPLPSGVSLSSSGELHGTPASSGFQNINFNVSDGVDTVFRNVNYTAFPLQITTSGDVLPNATQNAFYSTPALTTTGGSGTYTYSVSGATGGLTLNQSTGVLSGTITAGTGTFSYTINVTDTVSGAQSDGKRFTINVVGVVPVLPQVTNFNNNIGDGTIGVPFSRTLNVATGGSAPFTWKAEGLPPGMDIRSGSGVASSNVNPTQVEVWGTPVAIGLFNVKLTVTDALNVSASHTFPLVISQLMTTNGLPNGTIETPYSQTLRVIGGTPGYTVSQTGGSLENGVTINSATQTLAGTPHENGNFSPVLTFTDSAGLTLQNSFFHTINSVAGKINISTGSDFGFQGTGTAFSRQLLATVSGCCASGLTWTLFSGTLPPGVNLSAGGLLSGTLTANGLYSFVIRATDSGNTGTFSGRLFTLNVTPLGLSTSLALPFANVDTPYSTTPVVTGATGAITWTLAPFNYLPPGLSLVGGTTIAGTPKAAGFFAFSMTAADAAGHTMFRNFTLSIYPAGGYPPLNWTLGPNFGPFGIGIITNVQFTGVGGGVPPYHFSYAPGSSTIPGMRVLDGQPLPTNYPLTVPGGLAGVVTTPGTYTPTLRVTDSANNTFDRAIVVTVSTLHILSQNTLPRATRGVAYSFTFQPYPAGGAYTWSATNLPAGLSIDASTGVLSGTPTSTGNFSPLITLRDASSNGVIIGHNLTVNPFAITTNPLLPTATVGTAYSQTLTAPDCGSPCAFVPVGSLPAGLNLNSSGVLSGTPTATFFGTFTIGASGPAGSVTKLFTLRVVTNPVQPLSITNGASFGFQTLGNNVALALGVQGGSGPYTWTLESGALPLGVAIAGPGDQFGANLAAGFTNLIGRAMQVGTFNFTLKVTDNTGASATRSFNWNISPLAHSYISLPVTFTNPSNTVPTPLVYNAPYSQPLLVLGGSGTYTHTALAALPTGLVLDAATGTISGTPLNTGSFNIQIQAADTSGNVVASNVSFNIASPTGTALNFNNGPGLGTFQQGSVNGSSTNVTPSGGTGPYTLTAITPLPPGFGLQAGSALLSNGTVGTSYFLAGTPLAAGSFAFVVEARDTLGNVGARTFTLTTSPLTLVTGTNLPDASVGVLYSQTIVAWDSASPPTWTPVTPLPPGMNFSGNVLSGTPTTPGTFNFTLNGTDASGVVVSFTFTLRVSNISITDPQILPVPAVAGVPFTYTFTAVGGGATKTWTASSVPPGFSLSTNGTLTGTTSSFGGVQAVIATVNDGGTSLSVTRRFTLYARATNRTTLDFPMAGTALPDAVVGQSFLIANALLPSGGTPPYSWSAASPLPPGLSLIDVSTLGSPIPQGVIPGIPVLAGAPTAEGAYTFDLILTDAAGASLRRTFTLNVTSINILPGAPRAVTTGVAYAEQFTAVGGTPPYTFTMTKTGPTQDMLPPGLSLSPSGLIAGTTNSTGNYAFVLHLRDAAGHTFARTYSVNGPQLTVNNPAGLRVTNTNPFDIKAGGRLSMTLSTSGNSTFAWSVVTGSSLPPGMQLVSGPPFVNAGQTALIGPPTTPGIYSFTLRATDTANSGNIAEHTFTARVVPMHLVSPPLPFMPSFVLPSGLVGQPYYFSLKAAGGTPPYTFGPYEFAPLLPPGLTLSADGILSGTPQTIGAFALGMTITDATGAALTVPNGFALIVTTPGTPAPLNLTNQNLPDASLQVPFSFPLDIFARGGVAPLTWSVTPGASLPPGMLLLPGGNGVPASLGGIPTTPGAYVYSLTATDAANQTATMQVSQAVSPIALTPGTLPPGMVGAAYAATLVPSGGTAPYTFQLIPNGDFPPGVVLSSSGVLSGLPANAGDFLLQILVTDAAGHTLVTIYRVVIDNAAGEAPALTLSPRPITVNYLQGASGGAAIPVSVGTTSGAPSFTAAVSGIPGATVSPTGGLAGQIVSLNLDAAPLSAGKYVGVLGANAAASANVWDYTPIILNVAAPSSDTTPPAIGNVPANIVVEATSMAGATVTFPAPVVTDNFYPAPSVIVSPPSGSVFPVGVTTVTITATDASGNTSLTTFTVTVRDTIKPSVSIASPLSGVVFTVGQFVLSSFSCNDTVRVVSCVGPAPVGVAVDTSRVGTSTFAVIATDGSGNTSSASTTYTVVAETPSTSVTFEVLHNFNGTDGSNPLDGLVRGSDGNFYGTTYSGGTYGYGTVFKMDTLGTVTTLHSFDNVNDGAYPYAGLVQGTDGSFYGTANYGPTGNGTIFKVDATGTLAVVHALASSEGQNPAAALVQGSDGSFYGTAPYGGPNGYGSIFKLDTTGKFAVLHAFTYSDGANPHGTLTSGADGYFYGTTSAGGPYSYGTVFKVDTTGTLITLHGFVSSDGAYPQAAVVRGTDGNFYGTTYYGGAVGYGTVFKMDATGAITTLHSFANGDGSYPYGSLVEGQDGALYGSTYTGGPIGYGTLFRIDTAGTMTMLHVFGGADGALPYAGLFQDTDGRFYGTTYSGGTVGGTVFRLALGLGGAAPTSLTMNDAAGSFGGATAMSATLTASGTPVAGRTVAFTLNGVAVGSAVTDANGAAAIGSVSLAGIGAGSYSNAIRANFAGDVLFNFALSSGASLAITKATPSPYWPPPSPIVEGTALDSTQLNATATVSGTFTYTPAEGTVLRVGSGQTLSALFTPLDSANYVSATTSVTIDVISASDVPDTFQVLHSFTYTDGGYPYGALVQGSDGSFYGTTYYGGTTGVGTVYKIDESGTLTTLHAFDYSADGGNPQSGLIQGADGSLYGTNPYGGPFGAGTLFKVDPTTGSLTVLHAFVAATDGGYPLGGVIQGRDGNLYGTTNSGGPLGYGTVFKVDAAGVLTVLHAFDYTNDGAYPYASVIQGRDGNFYGTTSYAGPNNAGTLFRVDPSGVFTTLHVFSSADGVSPIAALLQGSDGSFYGTTNYGGPKGAGTVFKVDASGELTVLHAFDNGTEGGYLYAGLIEDGQRNLFGMTSSGTQIRNGTIFRLDPAGTLSTLHVFSATDGTQSRGALVRGFDGSLYGTAVTGGAGAYGTVYRLTITPSSLAVSPASSIYGGTTTLSATLTSAGAPVTGRTVTFAISGTAVGSATTDAAGVATLTVVSIAGKIANAYSGAVQATFTGDRVYPAVTGGADLMVSKRSTHIRWTTPADIIYGTPLESGQLNAVSDVPGTLTYSPVAGTLLPVGAGQTLSVNFTPADSANYLPSFAQTQLNVVDSRLGVCISRSGGLVSWWSGEGNGVDRMGLNPATPQGAATFSPGRVGQGFSFTAPGRFVVPPSASLNLTTLTLEAWVSFASLPSGFGTIATKQNSAYINYSLFVTSEGELAFYWVDPAGTHGVVSSGIDMSPGIFHHVAATADGARVRFYVDGVLRWDAPQPSPLVAVPDAPLTIGSEPVSDQFFGVIDELAIYDHALSSSEVRDVYLAGVIGKCPPPSVLDVSATVAPLGGTADLRAALTSSAVPLAGQTVTFSLNGVSAGSATTDGAGVASLTGVSVGGLAAGTYPIAVVARFAGDVIYRPVEQSASLTVVDTVGPAISIISPVAGAIYVTGAVVPASYSCLDPSGVTTCAGPVASGDTIDTSIPGPHAFIVTATDVFHNASQLSVSYTVIDLPRIDVTSPVEPIYELGSVVQARYSCTNSVTCLGDVANGAALDTSSPGVKTITISATDAYGNMTTQAITYMVSLGACVTPFPNATAWLAGDGTPADELGGNSTWVGTAAYEAGRVGQAFSFGSGSYVTLPVVQPGSFTLQAWVRTANRMMPAGTGILSTGASGQESISAQVELDGAGNYQLNVGSGEPVLFIGPATTSFQHIAASYDQATGVISTYLNGQLVDFNYWTGSPALGIQVLNLGINRQAAGDRFAGAVDETQLFNRALTADEILQTFNAGASGLCKKDHEPVAVIALTSSNPAEATGPAGATVQFDGSASSDADGDSLTYAWREGSTVLGTARSLSAPLPIGSHQITLTVDDGRFKTGSMSVAVAVQDTTSPIISGTPGSFVLEATRAGGAAPTWTALTATDIVDGAVEVVCLPASGTSFGVGTTTVTCTATDAHLNAARKAFDVTVNDTTPPVLAGVPAGITAEATGAGGAVVSWTSPTATDVVDGRVSLTCVPTAGSLFVVGTTHVECSAVDTRGNAAAGGFDVIVRDTTPPAFASVPALLLSEATTPAGAIVTYASPSASDVVDGPRPATCSPASGTVFALGNTVVTCSARDSRGNLGETTFTVRVVDTVGPTLTLPDSVVVEATGPVGAPVLYAASASDLVSGAVAISCAPASGSTFGLGVTAVTCSATDGAGNVTPGEFPVVVRDTLPPAAQIATPSVDAMLTGSPVTVTVQASDIVGVASVTVNGTPASLTIGQPQSGTWTALVPVTIVPGTAIELRAVAADSRGNHIEAVRVVDNDGLQSLAPPAALAPFALDRDRAAGADLSNTFSSEFNNGITSGSVTRNGWTVTLNASTAPPRPPTVPPAAFWPATGWVQVGVTGAAGPAEAIVNACVGGVKQIRLNAPGERGVFACDPATGTIAFKALSASPTIDVWKQISPTAWLGIPVMTGGGVSTGSPTTAFPDNPGPIDVKVVRFDDSGMAHVVGTFRLQPGASADVIVKADSAGRDDQFVFQALHGTVSVTMNGTLKVLEPGIAATLPIDRTPPRVSCGGADRVWHGDNVQIACTTEDRELGLRNPSDAQFSLATAVADGDETSAAETDSRTVCDGGGNCADVVPVGGNRVDRKPPAIDVTSPRPDAVYVFHQAVVGSFSCADGGSGVASCSASSDNGHPIPTSSVGASAFSVVAADQVGNSRTVSIPYAVTYALELAEDGNATAKERETSQLAVRIADALGVNQSAASVQLRATGIVSFDGTTHVELTDSMLRFDPRSGVYRLDVNTGGLRPGSYRLQVEVNGDPVAHVVPFLVN